LITYKIISKNRKLFTVIINKIIIKSTLTITNKNSEINKYFTKKYIDVQVNAVIRTNYK